MDISEITKVGSRKRVNADADKLREKVSRETAKIIKLKVAQDTAYWDLKEKLHQLENNHERLQQNMVEVQMQHEAISGQYQDELRLRPETLNKLSSTREICDVLEDYSSRLKDTVSRCRADQAALVAAHRSSGALVRDYRQQAARAADTHLHQLHALREQVKLTTEHQSEMAQMYASAKQQSSVEVSELKTKLEVAQRQKEELFLAVSEFGRKLDLYKHELDQKEEKIANLNTTIDKLTSQINEMNINIEKLNNAIKESEASNEDLKHALSNQEAFTKSVCDQNTGLQEKISTLEEEQLTLVNVVKELQGKLEKANLHAESLNNEVATLKEKKTELEQIVLDKEELFKNLDSEFQGIKNQLTLIETEKEELTLDLKKITEESSLKSVTIEEYTNKVQELEKKIQDTEVLMKNEIETLAEKIRNLTQTIEEKDKELYSKHSTINELMSNVKNGSDARTKLEGALQRVRTEMETERESGLERERKLLKQVELLEVNVRGKDDELSKQMSIILEMRNEKERLQEKIQTMQNKIDNIQKELTGKAPTRCAGEPPELDDNAVVYPAGPKTNMDPPQPPSPKLLKLTPKPRAPEPPHADSMLFNFLSDSSMDGDTLDPKEVNRRFEALARGDRMSPLPMASLKRKAVGGLKYKNLQDDLLPLSQVKNDLKNKERCFFKNKRTYEAKGKKK